jgi:hypothetical protein
MSAPMERRNISWKGRSFNQIVAGLRRNSNSTVIQKQNLHAAQPIRHYRKEIANASVCSRASISLDDFTSPGGTIVNTSSTKQTKNVEVAEFGLTVNKSERPSTTCDKVACSKAADARRRVRSSGNVKRAFIQSKNNDKYYTSTNEYLVSRNLTVAQNQYSYVRFGDATVEPGSSKSLNNIYSPAGINHCAKVSIRGFSATPLFTYQWIDGEVVDVNFPDGDYALDELVNQFQNVMILQGHYYINKVSGGKEFAMNFAYNVRTDRIQIQCKAVNNVVFPTSAYTIPAGGVSLTKYAVVPVIRVLPNVFQQIIGVDAGYYPTYDPEGIIDHSINGAIISSTKELGLDLITEFYLQPYSEGGSPDSNVFNGAYDTNINTYPNPINQNYDGTMSPKIGTPYVPLYYKPSNSKFATQGSVDASSRLARLKYDTITSSASTFTTAYGRHTANALAYGVPGPGATFKERIGYSTSCQPTANLITNQMMKCTTTKIRGG